MRGWQVVGISVTLFMLASSPILAQEPRPAVGAKAGLNSSKLEVTGASTSSRLGFVGGGFASLPLDVVSIQFEALYSQKGFNDSAYSNVRDWEVSLAYLDLPLTVNVDMDVEGTIVEPYFYAGISFGVNLSAKEKSSDTGGQWVDAGNDIASTNWALVFGGGVWIQKFILDIRYSHGLTDLNEGANDTRVEDRTLSFTVGYAIWE